MSNSWLELIDQNNETDVVFVYETRRHPKIVPFLFGKPPENLDTHKAWLMDNVPDKRLLFVMKVDEKPVGYCQAYDFRGKDTVEAGFVVHPEHQDRGYGRRMIDLFIEEMELWMPEKKMVLNVKADNVKAVELYKHCGFAETSVRMEML